MISHWSKEGAVDVINQYRSVFTRDRICGARLCPPASDSYIKRLVRSLAATKRSASAALIATTTGGSTRPRFPHCEHDFPQQFAFSNKIRICKEKVLIVLPEDSNNRHKNVPTLDHSAPHSSLLSGKFWNIFPRYKVQSPSSYSMACRLLVTRRGTVSVIESQIRHLSPDAISSFPWQSSRLITWDKGFYGSELSKPWHHLNLHFRFTKSFVHDEWVWVPGLCVDPEQKTPWRRLYPTN